MLIKRMLGKNKTEDYFMAAYFDRAYGIIALLVKKGDLYYDVFNKRYTNDRNISYKKPLKDYVKIEKDDLMVFRAKKLSKPHFKEFSKEFKDFYCKDKEIMEDKHYTFYAIV